MRQSFPTYAADRRLIISDFGSCIALEAIEVGAIGFEEASAEAPALIILSYLYHQRIPPGMKSYVDFVRTGLHGASGIKRIDLFVVNPNFYSVIAAEFEQCLLVLVAMDRCAGIRHTLLTT